MLMGEEAVPPRAPGQQGSSQEMHTVPRQHRVTGRAALQTINTPEHTAAQRLEFQHITHQIKRKCIKLMHKQQKSNLRVHRDKFFVPGVSGVVP